MEEEELEQEFLSDWGTCGEKLSWDLTDDGILTIMGTGEMNDYSASKLPPWISSAKSIKSIVIKDGVTSIGNLAFTRRILINSQYREYSNPE